MSKFAANPVYVMHEDLLLRLHALIAAGEGDSGKADAIRDEMDFTYRKLSSEERQRLEGLSADLYMLVDEEIYEKAETGDVAVRRGNFERAYERKDWPSLLKLIRQGVPWVDRHVMAFMRGNTYDQLGHYRIAELFYKKAYQLSGQDPLHAMTLLGLYDRMGDKDELFELANHVICVADALADSVIFAAWMIHKNMDRDDSLMGAVLARLEQLQSSPNKAVASNPLWYGTISACYLDIKNYSKSLEYWARFMDLRKHPSGWMEYMARGQLRLLTEDPQAFTDFEQAVKQNAQHCLPYYCLAEHAYQSDEYTRALALLERAMSVPGTDALYAACWELRAIIQATLGLKPSVVRRSFTKALEICPDDRIQQNAKLYEQFLDVGLGAKQWIQVGPPFFAVNIDLTDQIRTLRPQQFNSFAA